MTLACEDAYSKLVEVVTVAEVSDEDRYGNSLLQIWKLRFSHKALTSSVVKQHYLAAVSMTQTPRKHFCFAPRSVEIQSSSSSAFSSIYAGIGFRNQNNAKSRMSYGTREK